MSANPPSLDDIPIDVLRQFRPYFDSDGITFLSLSLTNRYLFKYLSTPFSDDTLELAVFNCFQVPHGNGIPFLFYLRHVFPSFFTRESHYYVSAILKLNSETTFEQG